MVDTRLRCHTSSPKRVLGAAPVGETSPVMRGNKEGGLWILTEGFDGRLDDEDGLAAMATWNLTATRLEHGEMKWKGTRGMGRCCGALDAFYRLARRAEGSGGNELPAVLDYQCWLL
jgi:hypothetical protein